MSQTLPQPAGEPESRPGKIRTWWHPLLANMLRWLLGSRYEAREEVPVSPIPVGLGAALAISLVATIYLGVLPGRLLDYAARTAVEWAR